MSRVLLIDDDSQMRQMLERTLARAGHDVVAFEEGAAALAAMGSGNISRPDILITDVVMPGMEGLETITHFRRLHPGVPIIAISGGGRATPFSYLRAAKNLGAACTFEKPFQSKVLLDAIAGITGDPAPVA